MEAGPGDVLTKLAKRVVPQATAVAVGSPEAAAELARDSERRMTLPVRDPWFDAVEVEPGIHVITEPEVHALILANVWLVRGRDRDLLVDTGNGIAPLRPFVDTLRDDPAKPLVAVATHSHMDHAAGLWEFDERVAHPADAGEIEHPVPLLHGSDVWPAVADAMAQEGFPVTDLLVTAAPVARVGPRFVRPVRRDAHASGERGRRDRPRRPGVPRPLAAGAHAGKHRPVGRGRRHAVLRRRGLRGGPAHRSGTHVRHRGVPRDDAPAHRPAGAHRPCRTRPQHGPLDHGAAVHHVPRTPLRIRPAEVAGLCRSAGHAILAL